MRRKYDRRLAQAAVWTLAAVLTAAGGPARAESALCASPATVCGEKITAVCLERVGAGSLAAASAKGDCSAQFGAYRDCIAEAASTCGGDEGDGASGGAGQTAAAACDRAEEKDLWSLAAEENSCGGYQAFLSACPKSRRAGFAKLRLSNLKCSGGGGASVAGGSAQPPATSPATNPIASAAEAQALEAALAAIDAKVARLGAEAQALDARVAAKDAELREEAKSGRGSAWRLKRDARTLLAIERETKTQRIAREQEKREEIAARLAALKAGAPPPKAAPKGQGAPASGGVSGAFKDCDVCPEMVDVPAGGFLFGEVSYVDNGKKVVQAPGKTVRVGPFALSRTEITRGAYDRFVRETGRRVRSSCKTLERGGNADRAGRNYRDPAFAQEDDHPAVCVSVEDAEDYIAWLNSKVAGAPFSLPSEQQFEYALRAGTASTYPWGEDPDAACATDNHADQTALRIYATWTYALGCSDGHIYTAPVGAFPANRFGLFDLSGNVSEWVADCYNSWERLGAAPTDGSTWRAGDCTRAVYKGGAWATGKIDARSASRRNELRGDGLSYVGFRVARKPR